MDLIRRVSSRQESQATVKRRVQIFKEEKRWRLALKESFHLINSFGLLTTMHQELMLHCRVTLTDEELCELEEDGSVEAQVILGEYLCHTRGPQRDREAAVEYYLKAAARGHAAATYWAGLLTENAELILKSAEMGLLEAQSTVAHLPSLLRFSGEGPVVLF